MCLYHGVTLNVPYDGSTLSQQLWWWWQKQHYCAREKLVWKTESLLDQMGFSKENIRIRTSTCAPQVCSIPCGWTEGHWFLSPPCYCLDCYKKLGHAVRSQCSAASCLIFPPCCLLLPWRPTSRVCALYQFTFGVYGCKEQTPNMMRSGWSWWGGKAAGMHLFYVLNSRKPKVMQWTVSSLSSLIRPGQDYCLQTG